MIRYARRTDIKNIMKFIDEHWHKNHILARDEDFFKYFYSMYSDNDSINVLISVDENSEIEAMLGFTSYDKNNTDISLAIWKSISKKNTSIGSELQLFLKNSNKYRSIITPGINKSTQAFYELMGYTIGKMKHWYRLAKVRDFEIAYIKNDIIPKIIKKNINFIKLDVYKDYDILFDYEEYKKYNQFPLKSKEYIQKRYFEHPIYKYYVYGLKENEKVKTLYIFRIDYANGKGALRFVDCIGNIDNIIYSGQLIDELLVEFNLEYVDIYEVGVKDNDMLSAGFLMVDDSNNIIPNYFNPYEQKNIDIYYSSSVENPLIFKGDGDQDRPS